MTEPFTTWLQSDTNQRRCIIRASTTLSDRIVAYPACAPQDALELINTDVAAIKALPASPEEIAAVLEHRRDLLDAIRSHERKPITSPEVVLDLLTRRLIRPVARKWLVYTLNDRRERKLVPHPNGEDMSYQSLVSATVPTIKKLTEALTLPTGGSYLLLYGGGPQILEETADELGHLFQEHPISDALFWQLESGKAATLYSIRAGVGDCDGLTVQFPDPELIDIATGKKARN